MRACVRLHVYVCVYECVHAYVCVCARARVLFWWLFYFVFEVVCARILGVGVPSYLCFYINC